MTKKKAKTSKPTSGDYYFDEVSADRAVNFIEKFCSHVKGELGGQPFLLEQWQKDDIIRPLFGWKKPDGRRKYRTCYVEIPRKNGKSNLSAAIALYMLFSDGEPGAEVISAAGDRQQANIVFSVAQEMIYNHPELRKRCKVLRTSIEYKSSFYKSISAEASTKHGFNCHAVIFDELHTQPNRELWDVLVTSTGARTQPLIIALTTAGHDRSSICWEVHEYARQVKEGSIVDPTFLPVLYGADTTDDWTQEATWQKANPGFGTICKAEYFEQEVQKAKNVPSYLNTFLRLNLNIWTSAEQAWISDDIFMRGADPLPSDEVLRTLPCFGGLDLASTQDLTAFAMLFRDDEANCFYLKVHQFVNSEKAESKKLSAGIDYLRWAEQGHITVIPGNTTDYRYVKEHIVRMAAQYDLRAVGYDPRFSAYIVSELTADHIEMRPMAQNITTMNGPTKEFEMEMLRGNIVHGGNEVLRWQIGCAVVYTDVNENKRVVKEKYSETKKVDGVIASIIAMNEYIHHRTNGGSDELFTVISL
jgi:phage terminase large subunit-like protein